MSRKGNPYDNAFAESFIKTLKVEEVYLNEYGTFEDAYENILHFIEKVYNKKRLHSALDYRSPNQFELEVAFKYRCLTTCLLSGVPSICSLVGIKLRYPVGQNLLNTCQPAKSIHCFFEEPQSVICCFGIVLSVHENAPRTIIKDCADVHLFPIMNACMPIQMHHGQAVLAFVPDLGFSSLRFVVVHIGQAM